MYKILVLGNYTNVMYHPLKGVDKKLEAMLPDCELTFTEDPAKLSELIHEAIDGISVKFELMYDAIISYWDDWNTPIDQKYANVLENFVKLGGKLLVLHNGISLALCDNIKELMGARFITHPAQEDITFTVKKEAASSSDETASDIDSVDVSDIEDFTLSEEPYQYDMFPDDKHVFFEYIYRGKAYPAGWSKHYSLGKMVLLTPGHTDEKFDDPQYIKLIQRAMNWLNQ